MGLLSAGTPLSWDDTKKVADHIRSHGITQFLHIWDRLKDKNGDELLWGDEIEYMVVVLDDKTKNAKLSLRQTEILTKLSSIVNNLSLETEDAIAIPTFHPEYGRYMLESTPGSPFTGSITDLLSVEKNMRYSELTEEARRTLARRYLKPNEIPLTLTSFPRLGSPGQFTEPYHDPHDAVSSHSLFLPEQITNPHARFPTLTANIRRRRGSKVAINLPIFVDEKTPRPFIDPTIPWDRSIYAEDPEAKNGAALPDHIYMDAMGFGMGCCCLQLTYQACNVSDARRLYDGLIPIGPIMLALTAGSPIWRGFLSDVDCRWNVVAGSVDDRTVEERGLKNIQSTNWQTLRFKPPPPKSPIGWRVEFRSMEVQMTDYENAAYAVFITLLSRAILSFNLNFYIPISKVDENMSRAQGRGASQSEKFYFRKDVCPGGNSPKSSGSSSPVDESRPKDRKMRNCFPPPEIPENGVPKGPVEEEYSEMTIHEIINGKVRPPCVHEGVES
ncbi:hypothetical protein HHX47_DHR3001132 [Lentinula edodes]|nr:hypothetical protein HHX47_DHR3001132 [Lentinula edodes]